MTKNIITSNRGSQTSFRDIFYSERFRELPANARNIYHYLSMYPHKGGTPPSLSQMAKDLKTSKNTLITHIGILEDYLLVAVDRSKNPDGSAAVNRYTVVDAGDAATALDMFDLLSNMGLDVSHDVILGWCKNLTTDNIYNIFSIVFKVIDKESITTILNTIPSSKIEPPRAVKKKPSAKQPKREPIVAPEPDHIPFAMKTTEKAPVAADVNKTIAVQWVNSNYQRGGMIGAMLRGVSKNKGWAPHTPRTIDGDPELTAWFPVFLQVAIVAYFPTWWEINNEGLHMPQKPEAISTAFHDYMVSISLEGTKTREMRSREALRAIPEDMKTNIRYIMNWCLKNGVLLAINSSEQVALDKPEDSVIESSDSDEINRLKEEYLNKLQEMS